jgi:hypothetical protein
VADNLRQRLDIGFKTRFTLQGNRVNGSSGKEAHEELIVPSRDFTL